MTSTYFQVEFYSYAERRWVALFAWEKSEAEAGQKAREWLPDVASRVVRVTQKTEVVEEWQPQNSGQGSVVSDQ